VAALAPISTPIGRRCRRGRLASLTRGELALIEWLKLDDRCSVIAAYPERHGARIAAAGWSEGRKLPGGGALCDRHGAEAKLVRELSSPQWSDARRHGRDSSGSASDISQYTAFSCFPPVHRADLEGRLRVEKLWGPRQRSGTFVVVRKPIEVPHDPS